MCEALGTEPKEEDIPVDFEDLPYECRKAMECYRLLPSMWVGSGFYIGKDYSSLPSVFDLLDICQNKGEILQMIFVIDGEVSKDITQKQKASTKGK
jgi:hypothetical protein